MCPKLYSRLVIKFHYFLILSISFSGVANGVEITLDLETYDSADNNIVGDGIGLVIENLEDYPLIDLNGLYIEPGKAANIQIHPKLYTISEAALNHFDYKDRKCVGDDELSLDYFESYGLSNCLVSAALTEINQSCPNADTPSGIALGCLRNYTNQIGMVSCKKKKWSFCLLHASFE